MYLVMLSVAELYTVTGMWMQHQCGALYWWGNPVCHCHFIHHKLTWAGLESKPDFHSGRPVTTYLRN